MKMEGKRSTWKTGVWEYHQLSLSVHYEKSGLQLWWIWGSGEVHATSPTIFKFQNKKGTIILYTFRTIFLQPSSNFVHPPFSRYSQFKFGGWRHIVPSSLNFEKKWCIILYNFVQSSSNFVYPSLLRYSSNSVIQN